MVVTWPLKVLTAAVHCGMKSSPNLPDLMAPYSREPAGCIGTEWIIHSEDDPIRAKY